MLINNVKEIFKNILSSRRLLIYRISTKKKVLAVTFDDGPHPQNTEKILEILRLKEAKATFFLSGQEADKFPNLVKRYIEEGHEIGNHAYYHAHNIKLNDITKSAKIIANKSDTKPNLFRPPYGKITPILLLYLFLKKITLVMWSIDSNDSNIEGGQKLRDHLANKKIQPGDIILFHEDYNHTVEALSDIIQDLKSKGFGFATISEILKK